MKKGTFCLIMLLFITAAASGAEHKDTALSQKDKCPVCGMFVSMFADWNAEIIFADSSIAIFDGPKDMFKYYLDVKKYNPSKTKIHMTAISVKDYYAKTSIDAQQAFFVIWGDVYGPMGNEPVPFEREADAKTFLKEHKGRKILRFKDITPKLLYSLDNP